MYIPQKQLKKLQDLLRPNKVVVIYGPRRVGKTTLLKEFLKSANEKYLYVTGDDVTVQEYLSSQSLEKLKSFVGDHTLLVIDEAQQIENIGLNLKIIVDHIPGIKVIATGSSTFDLAQHIGEPLVGRQFTLTLFPLAQMELGGTETLPQTNARLESRLQYGSYPEVVTAPSDRARLEILKELTQTYLFKDILEHEGIRNHKKIRSLLELLALQVGQEVSYTELGSQLGMSKNTIERYINLLEQVFIIVGVRGYSRNLRTVIRKSPRYYFYDMGVRNAIINNFNSLRLRNDVGKLWENYLFIERMKKREYEQIWSNVYFWRTYSQQEIDLIEEREGKLFGFEFTWSKDARRSVPSEWRHAYPDASFQVITPENYLPFIT
ncbi:MAG: ATP-binding protein [Patescibacteria group bacterium]